jgi:hypothetical protein
LYLGKYGNEERMTSINSTTARAGVVIAAGRLIIMHDLLNINKTESEPSSRLRWERIE